VSARSRRRRTRTPVTAPTAWRCCGRACRPSRSSPVSPRRTRDATSASSASSTAKGEAHRGPAPGACTGRAAAPDRATRRRATSSSEARRSTHSPRPSSRRDGGYAGLSDIAVDLRVDDHPRPIEELERIHGLHFRLFGKTPRESWIPVDDALAAELHERLAALGYDGEPEAALDRWAGVENLEERVDGVEAIDPVVLEALREAAP
jgi:hypothetical protein